MVDPPLVYRASSTPRLAAAGSGGDTILAGAMRGGHPFDMTRTDSVSPIGGDGTISGPRLLTAGGGARKPQLFLKPAVMPAGDMGGAQPPLAPSRAYDGCDEHLALSRRIAGARRPPFQPARTQRDQIIGIRASLAGDHPACRVRVMDAAIR